jgi:type II secretory pathway predicted ATPase ExeA
LQAAGAKNALFTREACDLIAKASHGIPRTINILCDTALVYGFATNVPYVDASLVNQVIEDKTNYGVFPLVPATEG